jgi:hypothetical protein
MKTRFAVIVCALSLGLAGCGDKINQDTFDEITVGMSQEKVQEILGGEGTREDVSGVSISGAGVAGGSRVSSSVRTYTWSEGSEKIVIDFADGKVLSKRKVGF